MSGLQVLVLGALAALVTLHMARPRFLRQRLSSARFFADLPPADDRRRRFDLGNPLRSRPLYPQLLLLALLAGALLSSRGCEQGPQERRLGLWVLVDTSYSMTTTQGGATRLDAARGEVRRFLDRAEDVTSERPCWRFSAFDLELRPAAPDPVDRAALERLVDDLEARALGTDLGLLRSVRPGADDVAREGTALCPVDYRLVVTDLPAPDWAGEPDSGWIWRDVAKPADNGGLLKIDPVRSPLGGRVRAIAVEAAAYGVPPAGARLEMLGPHGAPADPVRIVWPDKGSWRGEIAVPEPGRYRLRLSPGGAYAGDDEATIDVPEGSELRVDWRLPNPELAARFGWRRTRSEADLAVVPVGTAPPDGPVLVVGRHYRRRPAARIGFFEPDSPLLDGLNFDVAEAAGIEGVRLPRGFEPVLAGSGYDRDVWVARRDEPPGVYLPGLPTAGGDPLGHFSAALFGQSLRWLLAASKPPPLYTLTSPARPVPEGSRIALHPGEGKTDHEPLSRGGLFELRSVARRPPETPAWPWWLAAAAAVFFVEQLLLAYGGEGWR